MKARVKATGEIVEVTKDYDLRESTVVEFYTNIEDPTDVFKKEDLEFPYDSEFIDYWTRLEHQYAGMALQGLLSGKWLDVIYEIAKSDGEAFDILTYKAKDIAHTLVEKYKEKEK